MTLLTIAEAAPVLKRTVSGLRKLLRNRDARKRPPALRLGGRILFDRDELEAWIRTQRLERPARIVRIHLQKKTARPLALVKARLQAIAEEARS